MTAMETELIQVPDSIEPYIGFKYLRWHEGKLWSRMGPPWPINKPYEAECHGVREYKWEPTSGIPKDGPETTDEDGNCIPDPNNPKPRIALSSGLEWSWEPQPVNHNPVEESCHCGIYAVDTPEGCAEYGPTNVTPQGLWFTFDPYASLPGKRILVELAVWGKVIPGTTGMRGQFAYPQKIHGSSDAAKAAAEAYGVALVEKEPEQSTKKDSFPFSISLDTTDLSDAFMGISTSTPHKRPKVWYAMVGATALNGVALAAQAVIPFVPH